MRFFDRGLSRNGRHVRVGPLLVEVSRASFATDPLLDGGSMHFEKVDQGHVLEGWSAGALVLRLTRGTATNVRPGSRGLRLSVGLRGRRAPNPHRWPITARGRSARRAYRWQREHPSATGGCSAAPANPSSAAQPSA